MAVEEVKENPMGVVKRGPGRPPTKNIKVETKATATDKEIGDEEEVKLTGKELKALKALLEQKSSSQDSVVESLIVALREAQKPYESEADKENKRRQQDQMRNMVKASLKQKEITRARCEHMAGISASSDVPHPANAFTSIVWHDITNQLRWGICSTCQREFWPTDPDYRYWRSKRSFNTVSKSGERDGIDTQAWIEEQHPEPFGSVTGIDPVQAIKQKLIPVF